MPSIHPSIAVHQWCSRNDGGTPEAIRELIETQLLAADQLQREFSCMSLFRGPLPLASMDPEFGGHPWNIAAWHEAKNLFQKILSAERSGYDPSAIIGEKLRWWVYRDGYSIDQIHPNGVACEALVPIASEKLRAMIGI